MITSSLQTFCPSWSKLCWIIWINMEAVQLARSHCFSEDSRLLGPLGLYMQSFIMLNLCINSPCSFNSVLGDEG